MMFANLAFEFTGATILITATSLFFLITLAPEPVQAQNEPLDVVKDWMGYTDISNSLYQYLTTQAFTHLTQREAEIARVTTQAGWIERQKRVLQILSDIVGPFPERTPLNARITGTLQKSGYRVEKIIFESQPKFYVTSCLFLPDGLTACAPAIIYCSGHSQDGFRSDVYQHAIINLVKKGFIVFAFDPFGQGERLQYWDAELQESRIGGPTLEHSYPGAQCFLTGASPARIMIWDGVRAVDYLLTRKEVDPARIGITGRSGGGTQSAYIAAFDDRIAAAAPECYITNFKRLLESKGFQDAEQNFYHGVANGIDHADLLEVRAPRPMLVITTTNDFFSIQGARETAAEVRQLYAALGAAENFRMVEDDAPHASTQKNREAMIAFFQQHFHVAGDAAADAVETLSPGELQVTQTGQVVTSLKGESVFSLNRTVAQRQLEAIEKSRSGDLVAHLQRVKSAAKALAGLRPPADEKEAVFAGRFRRETYMIEKYYLQGEGSYPLPFNLYIPNVRRANAAVLFLHPAGKSEESGPDREIEYFVKQGFILLAPDLPGIGELGPGKFRGDASDFKVGKTSYNSWFAAIQIGRSLVGIQAGDALRLVTFLKMGALQAREIYAIARSEMCPVALYAALFEPSISRLAFLDPLSSIKSIVMNQYYKPYFIPSTVAGGLTVYDLPDLLAALAPRRLLALNVRDQWGNLAKPDQIEAEWQIVRKAYSAHSSADQLIISEQASAHQVQESTAKWLE